MTTKAITVIIDALDDILVGADESELEASEIRSALRAMNTIMARLAAGGINLGYTNVTKGSDPVTIADGAIDGLTSLLALRLFPKYVKGEEPSQVFMVQVLSGLKAMRKIAVTTPRQQFPDTLPMGSGNAGATFYPPTDSSILAEFGGSIGLESLTEGE